MNFISKLKRKKKLHNRNLEREFALEIVEIFNDKLEDLDISLPSINENKSEVDLRIKGKVRKELISEIEDFLFVNRRIFENKVA